MPLPGLASPAFAPHYSDGRDRRRADNGPGQARAGTPTNPKDCQCATLLASAGRDGGYVDALDTEKRIRARAPPATATGSKMGHVRVSFFVTPVGTDCSSLDTKLVTNQKDGCVFSVRAPPGMSGPLPVSRGLLSFTTAAHFFCGLCCREGQQPLVSWWYGMSAREKRRGTHGEGPLVVFSDAFGRVKNT